MGYDLSKTYLNQRNKILEDGPILHTTSAVCAAFGAATCCCPFDYVMTKYQVQKAAAMAGNTSVSLLSVVQDIYREPLRYSHAQPRPSPFSILLHAHNI